MLASPVGESVLEQGKRRMGLKAPPPPPKRSAPPPRRTRPKPQAPKPTPRPKRKRAPEPDPEAVAPKTLTGLLSEPWSDCICVWCMRPITDALGNRGARMAGRSDPQAIPAYWRSKVSGALYQGFACKLPCQRNWEGGWGTAYRGTPEGEKCEKVWRSRGRQVKETKTSAYPEFDEEYRKRCFR